MNLFKIIIIVVLLGFLSIVLSVTFPWIVIYSGKLTDPNPPKPAITYGEFPFHLEYEVNGQRVIMDDTYIAQYGGVGWNEGVGKYRKWKGYVKSSGQPGVVLVTDDTMQVICFVGDAEYYLGDERHPEQRPLTPRVYDIYSDHSYHSTLFPDELIAKYNIKLLNWSFTDPIVNSFK